MLLSGIPLTAPMGIGAVAMLGHRATALRKTRVQASQRACWVLNRGSGGPYLLLSTMVPEWPVVRSLTVMFQPCDCETTTKWTWINSPAFMTSGAWLEPPRGLRRTVRYPKAA